MWFQWCRQSEKQMQPGQSSLISWTCQCEAHEDCRDIMHCIQQSVAPMQRSVLWNSEHWPSLLSMALTSMRFVFGKHGSCRNSHVQPTLAALNCEPIHHAAWFLKMPGWYAVALHKQTWHVSYRSQTRFRSYFPWWMQLHMSMYVYVCLLTSRNALVFWRGTSECARGYICPVDCFVNTAENNILCCQVWCWVSVVQLYVFETILKFVLKLPNSLPNATRYFLLECLEEWVGMIHNTHSISHWFFLYVVLAWCRNTCFECGSWNGSWFFMFERSSCANIDLVRSDV